MGCSNDGEGQYDRTAHPAKGTYEEVQSRRLQYVSAGTPTLNNY